jgi:hypothetical protein
MAAISSWGDAMTDKTEISASIAALDASERYRHAFDGVILRDALDIARASWLSQEEKRLLIGVMGAIHRHLMDDGRGVAVITNRALAEYMGRREYQTRWTKFLREVLEVHRDLGADTPKKRNDFELKTRPTREVRRVFQYNQIRFCRALGVEMINARGSWGHQ